MPTAPKQYRHPAYKPRKAWAHSGVDLRRYFRGRGIQRDKIRIGDRDQWTCRQCGKGPLTEKESILDHRIPLSQDGPHEDENLQLLCIKCSNEKTQRESRHAHI